MQAHKEAKERISTETSGKMRVQGRVPGMSSYPETVMMACLHPSLHHAQMPVPLCSCSGLQVGGSLFRE